MAGVEVAHADEGYANTGGPKDGPVLTMMSKRLRALRKKYNRILQIEGNKLAGKAVNKEQEDVLKTKIAIAALIDEYEKLRQPLLQAVKEEVAEREKELMTATLERRDEEESVGDEKEGGGSGEERKKEEVVNANSAREAGSEAEPVAVVQDGDAGAEGKEEAHAAEQEEEFVLVRDSLAAEESGLRDYQSDQSLKEGAFKDGLSYTQIGDLLKLLYFAQLFDVRSQGEAPSFVWTRVHERSSCLSYDFVTDDSTSPLLEKDLDALSLFGSLLVSRPPNVTLSHKEALERCIHHAQQWLACSEEVIQDSLNVTYSRLRDRLNRILSSEYFTMTPELQTVSQQTAAAAATAAGQYVTKLVHEGSVGSIGDVEDGAGYFTHQDQAVSQQQFYQPRADFVPPPQLAGANGLPVGHVIAANGSFVPESQAIAVDIPQFGSHEDLSQSAISPDAALDQDQAQLPQAAQPQQIHKGQQHHGGPRNGGGYQGGPRGGRHGGMGGGYGMGGGGRGGYPNGGRGGRGRGGGFPNGGRGGYYEQGNYQGRNHYNNGGRGGRGARGSALYNGHGNGPAPAPAPAVAEAVAGSA